MDLVFFQWSVQLVQPINDSRLRFLSRDRICGPMLPIPTGRCVKPGCREPGTELHHITYDPPKTVRLCRKHHSEITAINGVESRKFHRLKLSERHRRFLYYRWLEGKRKPRQSHLTRAWEAGVKCRSCESRSVKYSRNWWGNEWRCRRCGSTDIEGIESVPVGKESETPTAPLQPPTVTPASLGPSRKVAKPHTRRKNLVSSRTTNPLKRTRKN